MIYLQTSVKPGALHWRWRTRQDSERSTCSWSIARSLGRWRLRGRIAA